MESFNVRVELADRSEQGDEDLIDALAGYSAAVSRSPRGWVEINFSCPAQDLRQAISTGLAIIAAATDHQVVVLEAMSTAEFDARIGFDPVPELLSVTQTAELLEVSRQRVLQMVDEGKLPGALIGKSNVIPRAAVAQLAARQHADAQAAGLAAAPPAAP